MRVYRRDIKNYEHSEKYSGELVSSCPRCGCIFSAGKDEYKRVDKAEKVGLYTEITTCVAESCCPKCGYTCSFNLLKTIIEIKPVSKFRLFLRRLFKKDKTTYF